MLLCYICTHECANVKCLFKHFKDSHGLSGRYGTCCGQRPCARTFHDKYVLSRHIEHDHCHDIDDKVASSTARFPSQSGPCAQFQNDELDYMEVSPEIYTDNEMDMDVDDLEQMAAELICKCKCASTSLSVVNDLVSSFGSFVKTLVTSLENKATSLLQNCESKDDAFEALSGIHAACTKLKQPFCNVDTLQKQNKYWKQRGCLVEPKQYKIGNRQSYKVDKVSGHIIPHMSEVTGQFVSVKEMLQAYLSDQKHAGLATACPVSTCVST